MQSTESANVPNGCYFVPSISHDSWLLSSKKSMCSLSLGFNATCIDSQAWLMESPKPSQLRRDSCAPCEKSRRESLLIFARPSASGGRAGEKDGEREGDSTGRRFVWIPWRLSTDASCLLPCGAQKLLAGSDRPLRPLTCLLAAPIDPG